jgi:eukaryotic-like serine/threonine-protein kinase
MGLGRIAEIDEALERLLELTPEQREAQLIVIETTDPGLANTLRRLLTAASLPATGGMQRGVLGLGLASDLTPPEIPGYRILALLGRGGMATVYDAVRDVQGAEQRVALKVLGTSMPEARSRERFLREQRILAGLRHPCIAALIDVGEVDSRPWLAMEFVDGRHIDQCFPAAAGAVESAVRAMAQVADAVQAAHERLIVHRDIKPSNVLVDGSGQVKLIDFGIAVSLDSEGPLQRATQTGATPLTLRYASPEQLRGETVGVASDVYQLGLLLYRLLTGAWPYLESEDQLPLERTWADSAPRKPSTAVTDRALAQRLRGDLDSILLRCLASDPQARYRSARDLQLDLLRHLESRPVHARSWSRGYLARAFLRRHRTAAAVSGAFLAALVFIATAALISAQRAREFARQSERLFDVAVELLNDSDPYVAGTTAITHDTSMRRIRQRLLSDNDTEPEFRARLIALLVGINSRRGQYAEALQLLESVSADPRRDSLRPAIRSELALSHARVLNAMSRNDEAMSILQSQGALIATYQASPYHSLLARIEHQEGQVEQALARLESAAAAFGPVLSVEDRALLNQLAILRGAASDRAGSIEAAERAYRDFEPSNAREIASWLSYGLNLAVAYGEARRFRDTDRLHRDMADWARKQLGPDHPQLAIIERSRAAGLLNTGRAREALAVLESVREAASHQQLPRHRETYWRTLAQAQTFAGQAEDAVQSLLAAAEIVREELDEAPALMDRIDQALASVLLELGDYPNAWAVARSVSPDAARSHRTAMVRVLTGLLGTHSEPDTADRAAIAANPCAAASLAAMEAVITGASDSTQVTAASNCEAFPGLRVLALGGQWQPDWADELPIVPIESDFVERIRRKDFAPRAPSARTLDALRRWSGDPPGDARRQAD